MNTKYVLDICEKFSSHLCKNGFFKFGCKVMVRRILREKSIQMVTSSLWFVHPGLKFQRRFSREWRQNEREHHSQANKGRRKDNLRDNSSF